MKWLLSLFMFPLLVFADCLTSNRNCDMPATIDSGTKSAQASIDSELTTLTTVAPVGVVNDIVIAARVRSSDIELAQVVYGGQDCTLVDQRYGNGTDYQSLWTLSNPPQGLQLVEARVASGMRVPVYAWIVAYNGTAGMGNHSAIVEIMDDIGPLHVTQQLRPTRESSLLTSYIHVVLIPYMGLWYSDDTLISFSLSHYSGISFQEPAGNNTMGWWTENQFGEGAKFTFRMWEMLQRRSGKYKLIKFPKNNRPKKFGNAR